MILHSGNNFEMLNRGIFETDIFFLKINSFLEEVTKEAKSSEKPLSNLCKQSNGVLKNKQKKLLLTKLGIISQKCKPIQKVGLSAWLNDLINIGKGYGKNTARNIASSIMNMQVAKGGSNLDYATANSHFLLP
ncbi:MAG: hypothetical protein IPG39_22125 [Bacteroidetes bacterium]|nr:hypothetical protein [Bacteroidota bacterium]